jgi:hypothetical protein
MTAEGMIANQCKMDLPRNGTNGVRIALDTCEQYTKNHFYERLKTLDTYTGGHSRAIARARDGRYLYGQWEDAATRTLPELDACGGHWGHTPESGDKLDYHYHLQSRPPFTFGCFGPNPDNSLVTVEQCRALYPNSGYPGGCGGHVVTVSVLREGVISSVSYDPWCPCFDATGSNVGTDALPVFKNGTAATGPGIDYIPYTKPQHIADLEWDRRCGLHSKNPTSYPSGTGSPIAVNPGPTAFPSSQPTAFPSSQPSANPTGRPTANPTNIPTTNPTNRPTANPTNIPTSNPTNRPTANPTNIPTANPTHIPTANPTHIPTANPTRNPTANPTANPTNRPTGTPTGRPSSAPTNVPTGTPTAPTPTGNGVSAAQLAQIRALIISQFKLQPGFGTLCNDPVTSCPLAHACGALIRLAFHDSVGGGNRPNGCIDFTTGANGGLDQAVSGLEIVFAQSQLIAPLLSKADLYIWAATVAIEMTTTGGGNTPLIVPFRFGRTTAPTCNDNNLLPSPSLDWNGHKSFWGKLNFTFAEIVAIMGAHSVGRAAGAETGFTGGWTFTQTSFGNHYYQVINDLSWQNPNVGGVTWSEATHSLMMLNCDIALFYQSSSSCTSFTGLSGNANCQRNPDTIDIIASFLADQSVFYSTFVSAFIKLTEFNVAAQLQAVGS